MIRMFIFSIFVKVYNLKFVDYNFLRGIIGSEEVGVEQV